MMTVSLLGEERLVIITNPEFLKSTYKNSNIVERFINYFENENTDTILVIFSESDLDYKLKINSVLKSKANIKKISAIEGNDLNSWIINRLNSFGFKIDSVALTELIERTDGDIMLINNELEKLMLYQTDKNISYNTVKLLVSRNLEDNIFNLLNAFVANDKKTLFQIYEDFMTLNEDEMRIISAISNKLEEILYTKMLVNRRMSKDDIATYFKVKPGRAYYMIEAAKKINDNTIKNLIERITKLDFDIKSGKIDKKLGLQLFILGA
jgi:DNA polymerase-3 subunit delta